MKRRMEALLKLNMQSDVAKSKGTAPHPLLPRFLIVSLL